MGARPMNYHDEINRAFQAIIVNTLRDRQRECEACGAPSIGQYCRECEDELNELNEQYHQTWMDDLDQDGQAMGDFCNAD